MRRHRMMRLRWWRIALWFSLCPRGGSAKTVGRHHARHNGLDWGYQRRVARWHARQRLASFDLAGLVATLFLDTPMSAKGVGPRKSSSTDFADVRLISRVHSSVTFQVMFSAECPWTAGTSKRLQLRVRTQVRFEIVAPVLSKRFGAIWEGTASDAVGIQA